ncbi:unnamed protein product [Closterium sp. NIES-53]
MVSEQNVPIFDIDFDAILAAMYALTDSAKGDCYQSVQPDPGIVAAALGASASAAPGTGESAALGAGESTLSGTAPTKALHTFTLDSGASRSFFRDCTTLTPLSRPVVVSLADPSAGPILAHSSTVLTCPAAPSGLLSGLHLPSFSMNLVSGADLQDAWVDQFAPGGQRLTHCTCSRTGRHLATFTRRPGSSLYTLTTTSPTVSASSQVVASSPASAPCSCHPLSHETLLWHHRLGHPSLPRLRGMAFRTLVSGLPQSLPPLPPGPAPTCVPCVEGRQRAAPHSSSFPPTEAPLQTLHLDMWDRARSSMIHAAAPHFLWPFAVQYAAHQINLQPRVSLPETTPTLRWTGKVGDAFAFRVWGSRAFVRDNSKDKLSSRAVPCIFLGFPPNAPGWQFYHPTSRRLLSSQDVSFNESVSYYRLFPYRAASLPLPPLFLAPEPVKPVEVAVDSGAARGVERAGAGTGGAEPRGAEPEGAEPGGADPERRVESGGAERERVEPGGAEPGGTASWGAEPACAKSGGSPGVPLRREPLSPQRLSEWYARRCHRAGAGAAVGATGAGAAGSAGPGGARTGGTGPTVAGGVAGGGTTGTGAGGVVTRDPRAEGTGAVLLFLKALPGCGRTTFRSFSRGLTERRELEWRPMLPESCPASPASRSESPICTVRAGRCVSRPRPPPVPGTHSMTQRPSTAPQRIPLPSPPASSLLDGLDPESDSLRAASPTVTRFLATAVTDSLFESTTASALVAELVDFAAACCLDFATSLVAESASVSVCPSSVEGGCALGTDVLEDRQEEFECFAAGVPHLMSMLLAPEGDPDAPDIPTSRSYGEAIKGPYSSQWQAAMDAEMAS